MRLILGISRLANLITPPINSLKTDILARITKQLYFSRFISTSISLERRMSSVHVKNYDEDDRVHIFLQLVAPTSLTAAVTNSKPLKFNLSRLKNEELRLAVERLRLNLSKKQSKKSKKKKPKPTFQEEGSRNCDHEDSQESTLSIEVIHNGIPLDLSVENAKAWVDGASLQVGTETIPIIYNPPSVTLDKLPTTILEGCPIYPGAQAEFTTPEFCEFYWKTFDAKDLDKIKMQISHENIDLSGAVQSQCFTPQEDDVGKLVLLVCVPKRGEMTGAVEAVVSQEPVTKGPGYCPFEKRHKQTQAHAELGCFRVMTYNLLADIYSDTEFAREQLFNYCPPEALTMGYRKHLLLKEITGYKSDLLCMQEVDKHIFTSHLQPALSSLGYAGVFRPKTGQVSEGCASFVRLDKFRIVKSHDIVLSQYLSSEPTCADIWREVCTVKSLRERIEDRTTILQVTVVESVESPGQLVCLANTHLYFHPSADTIRLLHVATALRHIQGVCDAYSQEGKTIAMVFCGDFNSAPHQGVYQLMTSQMVPSNHVDFSSAEGEPILTTLDLAQPKNIMSACGTPDYTNFTSGFQATLDYIFVEADPLEVTKVVPLISDEEVRANKAIPSPVVPSDHLALVCELRFR